MKRTIACLLICAFFWGSFAYAGSPYGLKRDDDKKRPSPNSASMEGLLFFEAAENASEDMLGVVIPDEPVAQEEAAAQDDAAARQEGENTAVKAEKKAEE